VCDTPLVMVGRLGFHHFIGLQGRDVRETL
jgi:hypothetical protein